MARRRDAQRAAQRRRHAERDRPRQRARGRHFHHMSSIAVAGLYDEGTFTEDMFDEGQKLPHPYHRTKFESEKLVRERVEVPVAHLPPVDRRRRLQAPARWTRSTGPYYFFKAHPEGPARAAGVVPADLPRVGLDEHRPGRLRRRRGRPHRPPGRPRRPGVPRRRPQGPARRRRAEHVRRRRARAARRDADRQADDQTRCPRACCALAMKLPALQGASAATSSPTSASRTEVLEYIGARLPLRRARHQARAARLGHRAPAARAPTPTSCGTTGSASSTRTSTRTARSRARSTARRW